MRIFIYSSVLLLPLYSYAQSETITNDKETIEISKKCDEKQCDVSYKNLSGNGSVVSSMPIQSISIKWINNKRVANVHVGCGSYCTADFYVGERTELSNFSNVLLLNEKSTCVAYVTDNDEVAFQSMFSKKASNVISKDSTKYHFMDSATILSIIKPISYKNGIFTASYIDSQDALKKLSYKTNCR